MMGTIKIELTTSNRESVKDIISSEAPVYEWDSDEDLSASLFKALRSFLEKYGIFLEDFLENIQENLLEEEESEQGIAYTVQNILGLVGEAMEGGEKPEKMNFSSSVDSSFDFLHAKDEAKKIAQDEENQKQFLAQLQENNLMLQEVFELYLKDTLEA